MAILLSGGACSLIIIREIDRRYENVRALCELIRLTKSLVEGFAMSAGDIIGRCSWELLHSCGYTGDTLPQSFSELVDSCEIEDESSREIMIEFSENFGRNYRAEQVRQCEYYLCRMSERENFMAGSRSTQKKLALTLSLSLALMLVILLL